MVRLALAAAAVAVALIIFTVALWFLGESLVFALEAVPLSPAQSMLITGAVGLVLALLLGLTAKVMVGSHRRPVATVARTSSSAVEDLAVQLGGMIADKFAAKSRAHPYQTMSAALAAGLAVGVVPELRKLITDLIVRH